MGLNPVALVETPALTAAVYPPLAATPALAADVAAGEQALANRISYITRALFPGDAFLEPSTPATATPTTWSFSADGTMIQIADAAGTTFVPLALPQGHTLSSVYAVIQGGPGHAAFPGGAPGTFPSLELVRKDFDGTLTVLGSATDASATVAIYESVHALEIVIAPVTIDRENSIYYVALSGERGLNYQNGLKHIATAWVP